MGKLLFFLLIACIVYWRLRYRVPAPRASVQKPAEIMVRCTYCGVFLPVSEAIGSNAAWYCNEAHRQGHKT